MENKDYNNININIGSEALTGIKVLCGTALAGLALKAYEVYKGKFIKRKRKMKYNFKKREWEYEEETEIEKSDDNVINIKDLRNKKNKNEGA